MVAGEDWLVPNLLLGVVDVPRESTGVPGDRGGGADGIAISRELREALDVALSKTVCEIVTHACVAGESEGGW